MTRFAGMLASTYGVVKSGFRDAAGAVWIRQSATASAVNDLTIANAAANGTPTITASGSDTNVGLTLATKGTGVYTVNANSVNRLIINPTAKTIVDGSATSLFDVTCATGATVGGVVHYNILATDATDFQSLTGTVTYAAVNKAGTITATVTNTTAPEAKAVSTGTLTTAWTGVDGTGKLTVKLQPTGSLTETTYTVLYTVLPLRGAVTIL